MKKIYLGALDYGLAFGVDRTLRDLLKYGHLSAIGCLVGSDLWAREFKPLKDLVTDLGSKVQCGLTVALSGEHVSPLGQRMLKEYGEVLPTRSKLERLAILRLLPDEILQEEIVAQVQAYQLRMEAAPDFIAVREGLLDRSCIIRNLLSALEGLDLPERPRLVAPSVTGRGASRFQRMARKAGYPTLNWGAPMPEIDDREQLFTLLKHHFDPMEEDTFVATLAGEADERLRRQESLKKLSIRECHRDVLASQRFFHLLDEREVFLS